MVSIRGYFIVVVFARARRVEAVSEAGKDTVIYLRDVGLAFSPNRHKNLFRIKKVY